MDVHGQLVALVESACSPAAALTAAPDVIATAMRAAGCAIWTRRNGRGLELRATSRADLPAEPATELRTVIEQAIGDMRPACSQSAGCALVVAPVAAINEAIGAVVVSRVASRPFTVEEVMRLSGVASHLAELIAAARLFETLEATAATERPQPPPPSTEQRVLHGIAASPGIAIGDARYRNAFPRAAVQRDTAFRGAPDEIARVTDAFEKTRNDLSRIQSATASDVGEENALIFGAQLLLLGDPMLSELVDGAVAAKCSAPLAVDRAFDEVVRRLRDAPDLYVRERVDDVEDLRSRILGHLIGVEGAGERKAHVVVASRTSPSLVMELRARGAVGIASELGTATSHGALLARALGVPAVTGVERLTQEVLAGDALIVDGDEGCVVVRPTTDTTAEYLQRSKAAERRRTEFDQYRERPAVTADGVRVVLLANIALGADLDVARENRAEGIGLYRTEFPFIVRDGLPSIEEQARIYARAYEAFPDGPITFRILDLAGDKFMRSGALGPTRGAFHGYRSIRILFDHPHVLRDQVQAFAIAAAGRPLRILVPMVTSVEEVVRIKQMTATALADTPVACAPGPLAFGAMIETPAAAEIVGDLAREVDFFSIGTNDLVQYTLVVDREDPRLSSERHAYHPAVLRMVRRIATQSRAAGKHVSVCGEMAARPDLAFLLLAMGVQALSVVPRAIPELKQALSRASLGPLCERIDALVGASGAEEIEAALRPYRFRSRAS